MSEGSQAIGWTSPRPSAGGACVFIDRDGVVNERILDGYVLDWKDFRWRPDALASLRALSAAGRPIVVVSNQSCVGRGLLERSALIDIMHRMSERLEENGSPLAAWYCCPHAPGDGCDCRKPRPGMLIRAAREGGYELSRSYMIGDTQSDVDAGSAAGCSTYLIDANGANAFARAVERIVTTGRNGDHN